MLVNSANNDTYGWGAVSDVSASIQGNQITLIGKASDFSGIGDISNGTQIDVSSYFDINAHSLRDHYPNVNDFNGFYQFTSAIDISLIEDTIDDVTIIESNSNTSPINITPIFDIRSIEVEIRE